MVDTPEEGGGASALAFQGCGGEERVDHEGESRLHKVRPVMSRESSLRAGALKQWPAKDEKTLPEGRGSSSPPASEAYTWMSPH